jgi:predicted  nucleic acid-binding Zn-ribbon protein
MLVDGHKIVYEKDLIAAKESLTKAAEQAQAAHNEAIDKAKLDLSAAQSEVAKANARIQEIQASSTGATNGHDAEEVARLKQEIEAANSRAESVTGQVLEYRKKLLTTTYPGQVTAEQLEGKTPEQLDAFEEALKALSQSRGGPGPYAVPGGPGGAAPTSPIDRAKALLESTPYRGVRNAPPEK